MARRRFLVEAFEGDRARVEGEQGRHLARVLRAQPGQRYELSDGASVRLGTIETVSSDAVVFHRLETVEAQPSEARFELLVSVIKFDRFEWILEKAAEFGVTRVLPLAAARSVKHLVAAAPGRAKRWRKILVNAAQQARRLGPPQLEGPVSPSEGFRSVSSPVKLMLSESPGVPLLKDRLEETQAGLESAALAFGPQGGWTEEERAAAIDAGFVEASLGDTILRAETACLSALAILSHELAAGRSRGD